MAAFHQTIIAGNLGRDPETRYLGNGDPVCNFSVAVTVRRKETTMRKSLIACLLALVAQGAMAKGSSHGGGGNTNTAPGFVPIEEAQRVMHFNGERVWGATDGSVLVCPFDAQASYRDKECTTKTSKNAWAPLLSLTVPGYEISGVQFVFAGSGGYKNLLVFWRQKR